MTGYVINAYAYSDEGDLLFWDVCIVRDLNEAERLVRKQNENVESAVEELKYYEEDEKPKPNSITANLLEDLFRFDPNIKGCLEFLLPEARLHYTISQELEVIK